MKNDTYEVLLRCYADAREGFAVFYDGCMDAKNTGAGKRITVKLPRRQVSAHVQQNMQSMVRENDKPWWERI